MSASPAERYAASRKRALGSRPALTEFAAAYPFPLDGFQLEACTALEDGHGVLVAAPTGAGKTVVGEFAVHLALHAGQKCFYTTPIKALSNQKYADLVARYGESSVGLLTGDNSINGNAPIVVMTTEVLRNMLYASGRATGVHGRESETLRGLGYVVMDEVHYLSDRFRGAVWEEVIIHLPEGVRLVSLSATVSNAEEFGDWLRTVRGGTEVVVEEHRPVPLWQHVLVDNRLYDLFVSDDAKDEPLVNPELVRVSRDDARAARLEGRGGRGDRGYRGRWHRIPSRVEVIERLDAEGLLPAITFIFSRAGCDAAVAQCLRAGLRLTSPDERAEIREHVERRTADLPTSDLAVLGYDEWLAGLERGLAAHHAGMLPTFKEVVEELFVRGLVKAVFATETLALGINMPARSVVLERLVKWNGESHADITPGEYTQLTGRAGRRGIDIEGHAVVVWHPGLDPAAVAGLASTRTYPLRSSFRPSYNMAVNLLDWVGRDRARALLESSFAQFQSDRAVVGLARQVARNDEALAGYAEAMHCDKGDVEEYMALRRGLSERESALSRAASRERRAEAAASLELLRPGDVIRIPAGRRAGWAVVLDPGLADAGFDGPRPTVLTADRQVKRLSVVDFPTPVDAVAKVRIPKTFNLRSPRSRRDLAASLRNLHVEDRDRPKRSRAAAADDAEIARLRTAIRRHPVHSCPDREDHTRWAERHQRLTADTAKLRARVENRSNSIARAFDRECALLDELGYLEGESVTDAGRMLARVYSELDLLAVECLRSGVWNDLTAPELAAAVSTLVYESRSAERETEPPRLPSGAVRPALAEMVRIWARLEGAEAEHGLSFLREPDLGFAWPAYRWASGKALDTVLTESDLSAGDFVRWVKQVLDLLGQLADVAETAPSVGPQLRAVAREAMRALNRDIVAYSAIA